MFFNTVESTDFTPKLSHLPIIFCFASIWSCKETSKLEALNFIFYKSCSNKKSLWICYTSFKSFSIKSAMIFLFEELLYNKVDFRASHFEAAVQLQIEAKRKMLGRSVAFGVKSVEKLF